jgi:hypothetical protein
VLGPWALVRRPRRGADPPLNPRIDRICTGYWFVGGGGGRGSRNVATGDRGCDRDEGVTGQSKWAHLKRKAASKERQVRVKFDAELIDLAEDKTLGFATTVLGFQLCILRVLSQTPASASRV